MKKYFLTFAIILSFMPAIALAQTAITCPTGETLAPNGTTCNLGYTPLEPIPGITTGTNLTAPGSLPAIVNALLKVLITAGALLAVLSLTIGGVQYMISGSASGKNSGITRAKAALWGILLIAGSWLILNTINPQLLTFNLTPCATPGNATGGCPTAGASNITPSGGLGDVQTGPVAPPAPPAANVSTLSTAQIQAAEANGSISGTLVNIPNNTFTWTGGASATDINAQYAPFASACTAANGSIQSGPPTGPDNRTLSMVCVAQ